MSLASTRSLSTPQLVELGERLLSSSLEHLWRCDDCALLDELRRDWPAARLADLLCSPDDDVVKVAAVCLGLVGTLAECPALATVLHHADSVAVAMADCSLWQIWFLQGSDEAHRSLCRSVRMIESGQLDQAAELLSRVIRRSPYYAEAYHQRAVANHLRGRYADSLADAGQAVSLNPTHFAAQAGQGNCLVQLGRYREAVAAYHAALRIHPRLEGIRQSIRQTRSLCDPGGPLPD